MATRTVLGGGEPLFLHTSIVSFFPISVYLLFNLKIHVFKGEIKADQVRKGDWKP